MKFYSIWAKLFSFGLKNINKIGMKNWRYWPLQNNKNDKHSKDSLKIQISIILTLYLYLERKTNATILKLYNNLNLR